MLESICIIAKSYMAILSDVFDSCMLINEPNNAAEAYQWNRTHMCNMIAYHQIVGNVNHMESHNRQIFPSFKACRIVFSGEVS